MQNTLHGPWTLDLIWWVTVVEIPALVGLFWFGWRNRRDLEIDLSDAAHESESGLRWLRDNLSAYKLEVAKSYASIAYLKEVERRLTHHLVRIEDKLDTYRTGKGDGQ